MSKLVLIGGIFVALACVFVFAGEMKGSAKPEWSINASDIEACSCPMFCQCYFNTEPAAHHHGGGSDHYCRFNMAYKVNSGHFGETQLTGAKFWITGDLGANFANGKTDWAHVTFDKAMTPAQREAIGKILPHMFPFEWSSLTTAEGDIDVWQYSKDAAHATLNGGKTAEISLKRFPGSSSEPVVIKNLPYFGVPRNDGFVMMPNEVEAYREGPKAFEFKGTTGFCIVTDMNSNDVKKSSM
jgi:hypothetical protein